MNSLHVFARLTPLTSFPALSTCWYTFFRGCFPKKASSFITFLTGYMAVVCPHLCLPQRCTFSPLSCFPPAFATVAVYIFSRAFHRLRLSPALYAGFTFSRAFHGLHVFPRFSPFACFPHVTPQVCLIGWLLHLHFV